MIKLNKNVVLGTILALVLSAAAVLLPPKQVQAQLNPQGTFITTVGGTVNAITATVPNISSLADIKGVPISFIPAGPNTGPVTFNLNSLGAVTVNRITNIGLGGGELANVVTIFYNGTAFFVVSPQDLTPPGTAIAIRGTVAPTGYLIEDGTCVSQTTYAALFTNIGTAYGSCSAGLFALPDSRGTLFAARDNQGSNGAANRITTAGSGCNAVSNILCGLQNGTLTVANIAPFTPTGTITNGGITISQNAALNNSASSTPGGSAGSVPQPLAATITASQAASTFTGNSLGSNTPHSLLNPVLVGLRAVKY